MGVGGEDASPALLPRTATDRLRPAEAFARELLEPRVAKFRRGRASRAGARAHAPESRLDGALRTLEPHELLEAFGARAQRGPLDRRPGALPAHRAAIGDRHELARRGRGAIVELDPPVLAGAAGVDGEHVLQGGFAPGHGADDEIA